MVYSIHNLKMAAERDNNINWRERLAQGRARTLMGAIERVEARGGGRPQMDRPFTLGRAGVMSGNWVGTHDDVEERTTCGRREVGQQGAHPGGLSLRRGQGLAINTPILNGISHYPTAGRGRGQALSSPSHPLLKDHPQAGRGCEGPPRCPWMMPQCLRPHSQFPSPPQYTS